MGEVVTPEPSDDHREQGSPVDRDRDLRLDQTHRFGGPLRIQMTLAEGVAPAPDRDQSEVNRGRETVHAGENVGVAGEIDLLRTLHHKTDRLSLLAARPSAAIVFGRYRGDGHRADRGRIPDRKLLYPAEALSPQEASGTRAADDAHTVAEAPQGGQVEMIEVLMGQQDRVRNPAVGIFGGRHLAPEVDDPVSQHRVGQQMGPVELDLDGRVTDIGQGVGGNALLGQGDLHRKRIMAGRMTG